MAPSSFNQLMKHNNKNSKFSYYAQAILQWLVPDIIYRLQLDKLLRPDEDHDPDYINSRVDYYNKVEKPFELSPQAKTLAKLSPKKQSAYYFDMRELLRYFPDNLCFDMLFGDITKVPPTPTLLKSRPISEDNANSVLLKLNKVRHYNFVTDQISFSLKRDQLVWRGKSKKNHHRAKLVEQYYNHPLCNIGQTNLYDKENAYRHQKSYLSIDEQLQYKFILSLEGNDVASNLKWIMSSNSLCFMREPRFETWFMEGRLIPNHHYVHLRDDFCDLEEKIQYFQKHEDEALAIINNANDHARQFLDKKRERYISLLVLQKYISLSGQLPSQ